MSAPPRAFVLDVGPRRGRPRLPEPRIAISSRVAPADYDKLVAAANARGVSVSAYVRVTLLGALRRTP